MTPADFLAALYAIGWSRSYLAQRLECSEDLPRKWGQGLSPVPPRVAEWLRALARAHEALPPPDWRTRRVAEG